ncbi:MAG TPA: metallophosphoesterase family protein [Candidatus Marinimicrobia bacterium]|jgi:hypothetical protein|nr:metallophosphoesterase family protein [Candidatus Neomarinimicrobiota bacterium]MDP7122444.1 metallophosphoesterase family protein [Candidatus Neomarinimicrobiota bacterium]MDP7436375.1 metallophosphoesterase family protein [Candidatus Neomarinimicrobiota bacterium]MDP7715650.1 metallophosphoesterase family protein [Candidatus Neomarinimicrobiota bacterium]HJL84392.1 metallophosphoesterase family protein [Candidatus Neomarinimicrobiota bacterium]|tara:strand:+ start:4987 stop:6018 length:1032 start_codon:yes stop_codon:yes gene_type:complete
MNTRTIVFRKTIFAAALLLLMGCSGTIPTAFQHNLNEKSTPWTHNRFDNAGDKFTFAIFSDLNSGEREKVFEVAVAQLSLLRPELILSVGDLIDGGTENRETLRQEWESFDVRASRAVAPVFKVGGNHDLTNLTMRDVWMERYGARYYHFIYKNVLFLALDSEDYSDERMQEIYEARAEYLELRDSMEPEQVKEMKYMKMPERATGEMGKEQSDFFLKVIAEHPNVDWTFLFMHKPVWLKGNDPEFATIESALSNRPYTLFNGHFHSYSHTIKNGRDYIMLGTTGGSQNAGNVMSFDHVTMVTVTKDGPTIGNLKLDGILDKTGHIPANGDSLCFQASRCKEE